MEGDRMVDSPAMLRTKATRKAQQLENQGTFLRLFGQLGTIQAAAEGTGLDRQAHYDWISGDAQGYRARWEDARQRWRETLEQKAMDRINDPQGNRGSDVLLLAMLNAAWPEKYRQNVVVVDDTAKDLLARLRGIGRRRGKELLKEVSEGMDGLEGSGEKGREEVGVRGS